MQSLDLDEAADFLKMNAEVLRRKAKGGEIPAKKIGKRWVFIKEHLADFVSSRDNQHGHLSPMHLSGYASNVDANSMHQQKNSVVEMACRA